MLGLGPDVLRTVKLLTQTSSLGLEGRAATAVAKRTVAMVAARILMSGVEEFGLKSWLVGSDCCLAV